MSDQNRQLFDYFKQLFAQVSNPPLDAIREELVTSLEAFVGSEQNLFDESPQHCRQLRLKSPLLTDEQLAQIRALDLPGLSSATLVHRCSMPGLDRCSPLSTTFATPHPKP